MNTQLLHKTKERKRQPVAAYVHAFSGEKSSFSLEDNRASSIIEQKQITMMDSSALQQKEIAAKKNTNVTSQNKVVQAVSWNPFATKDGKASAITAGLGLGALAVGAGIGSAGLAIAGGIGLIGGLGYLGYKKFKGNPLENLKRTRRTVPQKNKLLHKVMTETMDNPDPVTASFGAVHPKGDTSRKNHQVRAAGYNVRLDRTIRDPEERQRYLLHELTHARADRKYGMNQHLTFANLHLRGANDQQIGQNMTHQRNYLIKKLNAANRSLQSDPTIAPVQKHFIQGRLNYAMGNPDNEYDTVMNELLLYIHQERIGGNSPFAKRIKRMSHEAYQRRQ
ncbi:hypothetical protein KORDIASMS9_01466 [Kordia sp. SMS9]|nr:hypothetical protein KORDIASMS9_01466 [Kordia sp. SMS9]